MNGKWMIAVFLCCAPGVQSLSAAEVRRLDAWEFRRSGGDWRQVVVPHDWAITGPFDRTNDLQVTAIVQNGDKRATEHSGRTGALPCVGSGEYRCRVEIPSTAKNAALVFEGAMSEPEVLLDGMKIGEWKLGYATFSVDLPRSGVVSVRLHNRPEASRWYPGAGLYRPVWLVVDSDDPESEILARPSKRGRCPRIEMNERGFFVNGIRTEFRGACIHHDLGSFGAAWCPEAFRWRLRKLKDIGVNAIRTAHNPPNAELLDICDEEGVMVMAESFDSWVLPKTRNGYHLHFKEWWRRDLEHLVKVCRDHPCVVMYSIGNEIAEQSSAKFLSVCTELRDHLHRLDPSRPVTAGFDRYPKTIKNGYAAAVDIPGMNYRLPFYESARRHSRCGLVFSTESSCTVSSRGVYKFPVEEKPGLTWPDGHCSSYDVSTCVWGNLPDDDFAMQADHPWAVGEFVWSGFDYLGEPTPYDGYWPSRSSYFGLFDLAGLPKDRAYLYRARWNKSSPTLHVLPHWTWPGREGQVTPVYVYTSYPEAELFINGISQGRRRPQPGSRLDRFRLRWNETVYSPGELKVVAYGPDGHPRAERTVRTAGAFARCRESVEEIGKYRFVTVTAVDANGMECPDYAGEYQVRSVPGWTFHSVCNGDPTSLEAFHLPRMRFFHGKLVYVLKKIAEQS